MDNSRTQAEFVAHMRSFGYGVDFNDGPKQRKAITYTTPKGYKCRDNRLHEQKYLKENMLHEFRLREIQIGEHALGTARLTDRGIAFDKAVSATGLRDPAGAMGRDREDFAVDGSPIQTDPCSPEAAATRKTVSEHHERAARYSGGAATAAIGGDGTDRRQDIVSGGENGQAVGANVATGWESSRQRIFEMQGADRIPEQEIAVAYRESVPVHSAGGGLASDILSLAKNVSKIDSYEDDLDNIIALSALAGLSIVGACKLIEMLQAYDEADITDRNVEKIIRELYQQPEYLEGEPIWNTDNREQEQPQEHELTM
jgi:hypothetical protein